MNNNQFSKQEFEKRRVFKKATSICNAYSCPIFQNCLLEIKQLQQENARLKETFEKITNYIKEHDYDYIYLDCKFLETQIYNDLLQMLNKIKEN